MAKLALDIGAKRIGVAISDDDVVSSLPTIVFFNREEAISKILEICRTYEIERIIIGLSTASQEAEDLIRSFTIELNKLIEIPLEYEDETLTSKEAERILSELKVDPKSQKYKEEVDRISAKLILEQYLNKNR